MAKTQPDLTLNKNWQDLVATYPAMADQPSYIQNKSFNTNRDLLVVFTDSAAAPTEATGLQIMPGGNVKGTAAHIWVRAFRETVLINCGIAD